MKRTSLLLSCYLLAIAISIVSCSKEGPAGAPGPAGPAGPAGPTGGTGPAGATGTANVMYSDWLDVTYTYSTTDSIYVATISAPKLDLPMINTGEIKVYFNLGTAAAPQIFPLPYVDVFSGLYIQPYFSVQSIRLESDANISSHTNTAGVKIYQCRYVLIPGGVHARSAINWNDYNQVKEYMGWKD